MRAGVVVTAQPVVEDLAVQAETWELHGFRVHDTPVVHGGSFVALSLCAKATSRIGIGIGATSPALRSAPAAARGLASLNALAPGRIICGFGTGDTARRAPGLRPTTAAMKETFTASSQDLCDERRGTGLIPFGLLDPIAWHALHDARHNAARTTPHAPDFRTEPRADPYVITVLHVVDEDEAPDGDAARASPFQVMPEVFATGFPVGLVEWACIEAVRRYLGRPSEQAAGG
ncbi:LLM class flavin-dependent oxidoreductase [Actinomadura spongiicola]|uniref:LLM class flavin-dependent oxidoreductase n=1 Tax=Actinomadura spongiicola TaxID=2303421 RepID=UPI0018F2008C|nr:LLM class flavin-dependent oxidoreductase [Actinomadura spongiicola]